MIPAQVAKTRRIYQITEEGKLALVQWWLSPTIKSRDDRDELVIKVAMAALVGANLTELIQKQREAAMTELRAITKLKATTPPEQSAQRLLLERRIFDLEAEARWLNHIETLSPPKENAK